MLDVKLTACLHSSRVPESGSCTPEFKNLTAAWPAITCTDARRNLPASTEITGYAVSTFVYLHSVTERRALSRTRHRRRPLPGRAPGTPRPQTMPFEIEPAAFTYFFDCGIIVRGLLAVWRATGEQEFLDIAVATGESMVRDFAGPAGDFHPILALPAKLRWRAIRCRWSRTATCYQLKSAMAWWDLYEATGDARFLEPYERVLEASLRTYGDFLPGHPERPKVMDRLHAFCYFLEGLLPRAGDPRCAAALRDGIARAAWHLRDIAPEFERSDVYAQLLRVRLYADWLGAVPLDRAGGGIRGRRNWPASRPPMPIRASMGDTGSGARAPGRCRSSIRSRRPSPARRWKCGSQPRGRRQAHRHLLI